MRNLSLSLTVIYLAYIASFVSGCAYNKVDPVVSTTPVSFANDVRPILAAKCFQCHSTTSTDPNAAGTPPDSDFDIFDQFRNFATTPSVNNPAYTKVVARIKHIDQPGMPFDLPPLSAEEIKTIESWIQQGAQNN